MNALTSSGNLCLKWNNHSSAFLKSISNIQVKERFCDATIACQGKYFPVHRIILSTCSDYFDEIFERMQCQHPYIVFKDIDPNEMELLLNYMYQGEVNVIQEKLPSLIKAAEALKIKGLAVPDDIPSSKDTRKRTSTGHSPMPKRRSDERRKRNTSDLNLYSESNQSSTHSEDLANQSSKSSGADSEPTRIKEEPIDASEYVNAGIGNDFGENVSTLQGEEAAGQVEEKVFVNYPVSDPSTYIKSEPDHKDDEPYEEPSSSWRDLPGGNFVSTLLSGEISQQEDMRDASSGLEGPRENISNREVAWSEGSSVWSNRKTFTSLLKKTSELRCFPCPFCNYTSIWNNNLKRHIQLKHTREKRFSCPFCNKKFALKQHLQKHTRIHTREKNLQCPLCEKNFAKKEELKGHQCFA